MGWAIRITLSTCQKSVASCCGNTFTTETKAIQSRPGGLFPGVYQNSCCDPDVHIHEWVRGKIPAAKRNIPSFFVRAFKRKIGLVTCTPKLGDTRTMRIVTSTKPKQMNCCKWRSSRGYVQWTANRSELGRHCQGCKDAVDPRLAEKWHQCTSHFSRHVGAPLSEGPWSCCWGTQALLGRTGPCQLLCG